MNLKIDTGPIKEPSQLDALLAKEVVIFCMAWKQELDLLLDADVTLEVEQRSYGYDVRYRFQDESIKWFFQLELYYPNLGFEQQISYLKISRFITLPTKQRNGQQVFNRLLTCCNHFKGLDMIRLRSVRNAVGFWKKQNFRDQLEEIPWLVGASLDYDLGCLKRPISLTKCHFIYDIKKCNCYSCERYQKGQETFS